MTAASLRELLDLGAAPRYSEDDTVRAGRTRYFEALGSGELDYDAFWLTLPIAGVRVHVPNPPAHGRALRAHDLHHVLTGYSTSLIGEAEISAWELAGGCGRYVAAFGFDLAGFAIGLALAPRRTWRAYLRGRYSTNLFRLGYAPALLDLPLGTLRRRLGLDRDPLAPRARDYLSFASYAVVGTAWLLALPISTLILALSCCAPPPREGEARDRDHCGDGSRPVA